MKILLLGITLTLTACSIALNLAQYTGKLTSPQIVKLAQTDEQQQAAIWGGK